MTKCNFNGCNHEYKCKGYCNIHYQRIRKYGDPSILLIEHDRKCSINRCNEKHKGFGYCVKHYRRFKRYGDPLKEKIKYKSNICYVNGCNNKRRVQEYCSTHKQRLDKYGDVNRGRLIKHCIYENCDKSHYSNDYCKEHYRFVYRAKERSELKNKTYDYFGRLCVCCGESDEDVLNLDHIENNGFSFKGVNGSRKPINYREILRDVRLNINLKEKYQTMCANCNLKKHLYYTEFKRLENLNIPPF